MAGALVIRGLSKSFGAFRAVEDVSLEVAPGHVHSLIGPNGAGKTTAFNCVSGFLQPDAGQVLLNGRDVTGWAPHRLVSAGMARTFQITRVFGELTVLENVALAARSREGRNLADVAAGAERRHRAGRRRSRSSRRSASPSAPNRAPSISRTARSACSRSPSRSRSGPR